MRHSYNYIALSLLAAAFAGCSSTDTGSTSTSSNGGQDPITGPLAGYTQGLKALASANSCVFDSASGAVKITMAAGETAVISKASVDSMLMINGVACAKDTAVTPNVDPVTSKVKSIAIGPVAATPTALDASSETVLIDIRNGAFATASGANGGIAINLGTGAGTDKVAVQGSVAADKLGCKKDATSGVDWIGLKNATSGDIQLAHAPSQITVDLSDGDDAFDQGDCTTAMEIYGGAGKDLITTTKEATPTNKATFAADKFHGGAGLDTISYVNRTTTVTLTLTGAAISGATKTNPGDENDSIDGFETVTGGSGNDTINGGSDATIALYTLNGGPGNDTFTSVQAHPVAFNGGTGTDLVTYAARTVTGVTVTMGDGLANDGQTADADNIGKDVENLIGTQYDDTITGNALANQITPGLGNDKVDGGDGDDTFVATQVVDATDGNDSFIGGKGTDTIDYSARVVGVCVTLNGTVSAGVWAGKKSGRCAAGTDAVAAPLVVTAVAAVTLPPAVGSYPIDATEADYIGADVENAIGTVSSDLIVGNGFDNVITGKGGADLLVGLAGNDQIDANDASMACHANTVRVVCGSDPLDIVTCTGAISGTDYGLTVSGVADKCWSVQ